MGLDLCQKQCRLLRAIHLHMYTVTAVVFICVVLPVVRSAQFYAYFMLLFSFFEIVF